MLKSSAILLAAAIIIIAVPSSQHSAYASAVASPSARPGRGTASTRSGAPSTQQRHARDLAADQAAVSQGTIAAKGGVTVTEAIVVQNYALTTYRDNFDNDQGQCIFVQNYAGGWDVKTCSAGFFSVSNIQTYGYTTPYWIAYNLATSSPQTWANEQTVDRMNGWALPIAPSCTPDSYGYCVASVSSVSSTVCGYSQSDGQSFAIYNDHYPGQLNSYTWIYVDDGNCNPTPAWQGPSGYDATGDPAMPGGGQDQSGAPRG